MFVKAGELNRRITILRPAEEADGEGYLAPAKAPEAVHRCAAKFTRKSGAEAQKDNADFSTEQVRFLIRYTRRPITRRMLVELEGRRYEIEYINDYGGRQWMELQCRRETRED